MTKLLCITDIHGATKVLQEILCAAGKCDAILLGGDITHFGEPEEAARLVRLAQEYHPNVFAVAGNCDSAEIERCLEELGVGINGKGQFLKEFGIHGLSGAPLWRPRMYEFSEIQLAQALDAGAREISAAVGRVVLSHAPPRGCDLDRTFLWKHVGSTALRDFIDSRQPDLVVCGHIHEARGINRLGQTTVVNCGSAARGYYALAELNPTVQITLLRISSK
jgi:Icc-related predicted phosphoesterase